MMQLPYPENRGRTHWDDCWRERGHHNCAIREVERSRGIINKLLNHCSDMECMVCGEIICPQGEPLHFHHDGCPACTEAVHKALSKAAKRNTE